MGAAVTSSVIMAVEPTRRTTPPTFVVPLILSVHVCVTGAMAANPALAKINTCSSTAMGHTAPALTGLIQAHLQSPKKL